VDAPFVFTARKHAPSAPPAPVSAIRELPVDDSPDREVHLDAVIQSPPPDRPGDPQNTPEHHGFFGRVKGFFSSVFK
jgi:hypothetical protein